eukprot:3573623-Amphidinium_carterae.1
MPGSSARLPYDFTTQHGGNSERRGIVTAVHQYSEYIRHTALVMPSSRRCDKESVLALLIPLFKNAQAALNTRHDSRVRNATTNEQRLQHPSMGTIKQLNYC